MTTSIHYAKMQRALAETGDTHDLEDIVALIKDGMMQSFLAGESWCVTEIIDYPKKRVCQIFLYVGTLADLPAIRAQVEAFAIHEGCNFIRAQGRDGWTREYVKHEGWTNGQRLFVKQLGG